MLRKGWYTFTGPAPGLTYRSSVYFNDVFFSTDVTGSYVSNEPIYNLIVWNL